MQQKLNKIYAFLKSNNRYNYAVQAAFYNECISPYKKNNSKVKSLLYHILNTQSQPKLEKVAEFWKTIEKTKASLSSFKGFFKAIGADEFDEKPFESLFKALKKQPGWGNKTAALFVKAIYHVHAGKYKQYAFWKDVPALKGEDSLQLPVDTVITYIFKKLSAKKIKSFKTINDSLKNAGYKGAVIAIWDDLWYWGFITQRSSGKSRRLGFNDAKYWALLHTNKNQEKIGLIKKKAERFIKLVIA